MVGIIFFIIITLCILVVLGFIVYLIMICPRITAKPNFDIMSGRFYAHRGLFDNESDAPENSLAAFRRAVEAGFGMELDVQLSKDGIPVVFHDFTLERACKVEGKISDYTYEQLQKFHLFNSDESIPKFSDVLDLVAGKYPLIIEYKLEERDDSVCKKADELLANYSGPYCIESFNPLALLWYKKNRPDVIRGQLSNKFKRDGKQKNYEYFIMEHLLLNVFTKPDFIAYNHKYANNLSRRLCRSLYKIPAFAWTIRKEKQLSTARSEFDYFIFDSFIPKDIT